MGIAQKPCVYHSDISDNESERRLITKIVNLHSVSVEFYRRIFFSTFLSVTSGTEHREKKRKGEMGWRGHKKVWVMMSFVHMWLWFTCGLDRLNMVELNFRRCSGRRKASLVGFCIPGSSEILDACTGEKAFELCKRVFTTSNGHVTTAPAVPATLLRKLTC